jgi:hypothetical protein
VDLAARRVSPSLPPGPLVRIVMFAYHTRHDDRFDCWIRIRYSVALDCMHSVLGLPISVYLSIYITCNSGLVMSKSGMTIESIYDCLVDLYSVVTGNRIVSRLKFLMIW